MSEQNPEMALVTGGGGAIGGAVCEALAKDGLAIAVVDLDRERAEQTAERIRRSGANAKAYCCDVGAADAVDGMLETVVAEFGEISVIVHSAGIGGAFHTTDEVQPEQWDRIFSTNLKSAFLIARRVLPRMRRRRFGRIVHVASIQGLVGARLSSTYVATKHGLIGYTKAVAAEWGEHGITCNAVCPGYVESTMGPQPQARPGHLERIVERTPNRRIAQPAEVADLVRFLVRPACQHINGAVLTIDGGILADVGI